MKLHLPKLLRNAVLACITAVAGISTTVGTAALTGGVLTFVMTAPQVLADYTWIGGTGTATPKTQADWDTASNWELGGESFNSSGKGPGTPNSNLWELIKINGGTEGVQIGSEDARIGLEGWKPRLLLDSKASLYANINKFQDTCTFTVNNDSMLNLTHTGGHFKAATFNVGAGSSIVLNLTTAFGNEMQTINLNAPDATMTIAHAGDLGTMTGPVTVNASLADIDEGTLGVQNVGLILDNVAISGELTFNFGAEWTLSETEITEENKAENEGKYYVYAEEGVYKVVYSQRNSPAWYGGALSLGADTEFSNGHSYTEGCDLVFSKTDAEVTVVADVEAGLITVKDGIKVSIGGEHTLTAESLSLGANAQLSILNASAVSLGAVSMKDGGQLNIATGGETTVQDVLGSATWTGGAIGVTNGTTVSLADAVLNDSNIVVDASTLKVSNVGTDSGKVYLAGDVKLQNNAVMEVVEGAGPDVFNYGNANKIEILGNSELRTNNNRLSLQASDEIILNNGKITGTGDSEGLLDFIEGGAVVVSNGTSSIEGSIRLRSSGATTTFQVDSGTLTLNAGTRAAGNLAKTGAGIMVITGATNHTGTTTVTAGELILQATGNTGKGAITLGAGGTLTIAESANQAIGTTISGAGTLNLNGTLTIDLASYSTLAASGGTYSDGDNGYAEGLLVASVGTVNKGSTGSVVVIDGETTNTYTSADITVSGGNMYVGSGNGTYFINTDVTYDAAKLGEVTSFRLTSGATFRTADASVLAKTTSTDATSTLYLDSPGSVMETSGTASTYKGNVVITSGTEVKVMHKQALGVEYTSNATQTVTVEDGAVLDVNGQIDIYHHVVLEQGATFANKGGAVGTGNKQNPRVSLNGDATICANADYGIVGAGYGATYLSLNGHTLTKTGGASFNLWNTNLNAGVIDIQEGTLRFGVNLAGSDSVDLKMNAGTVMDIADKGGNATLSKSWNSLVTYGGFSAGDVQLNQIEGVALTIANGTTAATRINKTGAGSLTLSGATSLSAGITVSEGTLTLNGATTLGGMITIESGATLALGEGATVTLSSLAGFTASGVTLPTTNGLVSGSTYKIVDNKNEGNANNGLVTVSYNGQVTNVDSTGCIAAGAKVYYAVEAGDDKVVTVGGASATADTANATEFYVGENGTLKIADNASDSLTAAQVLATTTGDGTIVLTSAVGVAEGTTVQFAGKLSIATEGVLNFNPGKGKAADLSQVTAVELDGGTVNYDAAPDVWNSVSVTTNGGTMNIQDHPDRNTTPIQFTGVTSLAGDLTINTKWKSYLNIEQLTGAGDLILSSTAGNADGLGANAVIGVQDGFAGDIDIRGKAANIQHVTVNVASGYTLAASRIIINDAAGVDVKLSGSGTYTNGDSLALAEGISLADGWKGTVAVTGANVTSTVDASSLTNIASKLALNGLTVADGAALTLGGNVSLGGTVSLAESIAANGTLTLGKDLKLSVAESMIADGSGSGVKVITLITGAGASAVGSMTTAMLSDDLLALGVEDSWVFNADGTISFTSANTAPKLVWGGGDGNLSDSSKYADGATYEPGQDITFGAVTDGNADTITVAASDSIANATVQTGGNYVFIGTKLNVTGKLSIASGATVDAQSGLTIGTSLESTGTLKTTIIDGTGNVNITGGSLELSGSNALVNTGTKSISSAELKGSWTATGVSLGTGVTVGEGGTITLTDTTMAGTVTNKGNLTLTGTVNITPSASFQTQESGVQYSDGTNGLKFADVTYTIATGSGTTTASDVTWKLDGTATTTATYSEGKLNVKGAQQGTLYWANSGTVTYGTGGLAGATGIALNGGNVELNTSLDAQSMTDGIQANAAGTVSLGSGATLASTQVNGASETNKVTLAGSGTYALGESTALNTGVVLGSDWQGTVQSTVSSITSDTTLALGNKVDFSAETLTLGGILTAGDSTALTMKALSFSSVGDSEGVARLTGSSLTLTSIAVTNDALSGLTTGTWTLVDVDTLTGVTAIEEIVGAGVDNLYKYTFTVKDGVVTMKGEVNGLVWGSNDADFGADTKQSWDSSTTTSDTNVVFNGQCSSTDDTSAGTVNVDSNGVAVKDVTITQDSTLADAQKEYTFTGGDIEAEGSLTVLEDTSLTVENNSTFKAGVEVANGSLTVGETGYLTVGTDAAAADMKVDATNGSLTVSAGASVTVTGKLSVDTIEVAKLDSTKDVMISANEVAAATDGGKITIDLVDAILDSVTTGTYSLIKYATGAEIVLNSADEQAILKKGYWVTMGETSTFALRNAATTYGMNVSDKDVTWNVGDTAADNRLTVLNQNGMLLSADMLNEVDTVKVKGSKSIDLTTSGANFDGEVKLNKLTADGTGAALAIKGDGATKDTVSITSADGGYTGSVKLNGVTAQLGTTAAPVKGATVVVEGDTVVLNGALEDGTLVVDQGAALTGNALTVKNSTVGINIGAAGNVLANSVVEKIMKDGLVKIEGITTDDTDKLAVGSYSDAAGFQASTAYDKYFTNMTVEDNVVRVTRNTNFYSSKLGGLTKNGKAGMTLADAVLLKLNPQGAETATPAAGSRATAAAPAPASGLAKVLDQLDVLVASGNVAAADELGAALAGASTAVLGSAVSSDVERQLKAIRNRTTTMGVDQGVIHHDMPYFNAWINAEGDHRELADNGTESGYKVNSWGGTVGFDVDIAPTFTAGMALTAMYGDLDATGADKASGDVDTYYVSAFARYCASAWTHTFVATAGLADVSLNRTLMGEETKGETDGMSFGLMYEVGRVFALNEDSTACLQPVFNVTWRHTQLDGYTEKGSDLALNVDKQTMDTITFGMGARLQAVVGESMYNRTSILECRLLAKADVGDRQGSSEVTLAGTTVEVDATEQGAIGLEAGAGLTIPLGDAGASLFMDASVELRADYTKVNGTVGYRVNF